MHTQTVQILWSYFFPKVEFDPSDKLCDAIKLFYDYFCTHKGKQTLLKYNGNNCLDVYKTNGVGQYYVFIHLSSVQETIALPDFKDILLIRPKEVIACMGIASSIVYYNIFKASTLKDVTTISNLAVPTDDTFAFADTSDNVATSPSQSSPAVHPLYPQLIGLQPFCPFYELKSESLGRLVSIVGYVTAVSHSHHLITGAVFSCSKCNIEHMIPFEDGIFNPPTVCPTTK